MPTADPTHEVVPKSNGYRHYLFAFTPECHRVQDGQPCQDDQFGVTNLSGKPAMLANGGPGESNLSKQIVKCLGTVVQDYDADKYMQVNYEAPHIQAAVMQASMPLARFIIYCPPCTSAITTAAHLCEQSKDAISEWTIRVDHRLGCACCADKASALARISMIADTIVDTGAGHHWAKPNSPETKWMNHIDRVWLEGILYFEDDEPASEPSSSDSSNKTTKDDHDFAGIRDLMSFEGKVPQNTVAVILADVDSASWIINAAPFPKVKREPRTGEMFHLQLNSFGKTWQRSFLGTFETKGALKRRRVASPPPEAAKPTRKGLASRKGRLSKVAVGEDGLQ